MNPIQTVDDAVEENTKELTPDQIFHRNQLAEHKELDERYDSFERQEQDGKTGMIGTGSLGILTGGAGIYLALTAATIASCLCGLGIFGACFYAAYLGRRKMLSAQAGMDGVFRRKRALDEQAKYPPSRFH